MNAQRSKTADRVAEVLILIVIAVTGVLIGWTLALVTSAFEVFLLAQVAFMLAVIAVEWDAQHPDDVDLDDWFAELRASATDPAAFDITPERAA